MAASCRSIGSIGLVKASWERFRLLNILHRSASSSPAQTEAPRVTWQLHVAVVVQRYPVITQPKNEMEKRFEEIMQQIELEKSFLSDHELRHKRDIEARSKSAQNVTSEQEGEVVLETALEFEDRCEQELKQFKFGPRETEADRTGNHRTIDRYLENNLVLLIEQKFEAPSKPTWMFPQQRVEAGMTLRQTADQVVGKLGLKAQVLGNAPVGFYQYRFPRKMRDRTKTVGGKLFFYRAIFRSGDLSKSPLFDDFQWLRRSELPKALPPRYVRRVNEFFIDY